MEILEFLWAMFWLGAVGTIIGLVIVAGAVAVLMPVAFVAGMVRGWLGRKEW